MSSSHQFLLLAVGVVLQAGCSSGHSGSSPSGALSGATNGTGASSGTLSGASGASSTGTASSGGSPSGASGVSSTGTASSGGSSSGASGASSTGTASSSGSSSGTSVGQSGDAGSPAGFWDTSNIPPATNALMFKFLNRTNGTMMDSAVYWSFKDAAVGINELHSLADKSTYDMPANASGRMYFYLCPTATDCAAGPASSKYYDFIEFTIGATVFNGNTSRVDAWGIKIAMDLHCKDGYDVAVGENYQTFVDSRMATFQQFQTTVPMEFQGCVKSPYRIVEPGGCGFNAGGMYATYYNSFVDQLWAANGLTIAKPGPNASGLGAYPSISAAVMRHVGATAGTFDPAGKLLNNALWSDSSTFYSAAPADYYAQFWHQHALRGKAYGFPYDDVGGWSSYISHNNPQYLIVAIGW